MNNKDVFETLIADHDRVGGLLAEMKNRQDPARKMSLFREIRQELEIHSSAEELVVYPRLRTVDDELAEEAELQHEEIRGFLDTLNGLDGEDENWDTAVLSLEKAVRHHFRGEESEIFDTLRDGFTDRELDEMKIQFLDAKRSLKLDRAA